MWGVSHQDCNYSKPPPTTNTLNWGRLRCLTFSCRLPQRVDLADVDVTFPGSAHMTGHRKTCKVSRKTPWGIFSYYFSYVHTNTETEVQNKTSSGASLVYHSSYVLTKVFVSVGSTDVQSENTDMWNLQLITHLNNRRDVVSFGH